jgi:4-hydroxy-3-polyprenylbenzoate decarboxylase
MRFIIALTGASGQIYALRLLRRLAATDAEIGIILSEAACVTLAAENNIKTTPHAPSLEKLFGDEILASQPNLAERVKFFNPRDIGASIASGSNLHDGMVIVPCSMGTLARVAHGVAEDLMARAADVTLKERRKLILVARETPLSLIHLRNMTAATEAGAVILPAVPHFYHQPKSVEEVVDTVVERVLAQLHVETPTQRWRENEWRSDPK